MLAGVAAIGKPKYDRVRLVRAIIGIAALAGMLCSPKLWVSSGRLYPLTPLFGWLPQLPYPADYILFGVTLAALAGIVAWPRPAVFLKTFLVAALLLVVLDQSRLQPWLLQYAVMFGAFLLAPRVVKASRKEEPAEPALHACRLYMVVMYFWAGLQKLNYGFMVLVAEMLKPMAQRFGFDAARVTPQAVIPLGIVFAVVECASGVLLAFPRFRRIGLACLILMHATLLVWLGPLGLRWNYTIWPWNIAMIALLVALFLDPGRWDLRALWRSHAYAKTIGLVFGLLPVFTMMGLLDSYLGFALYSGNAREAVLYIDPKRIEDLPAPVRAFANPTGTFDINRWAESELGVPVYPESRIYTSVGRQVAGWLPGAVVRVIELDRPHIIYGTRQAGTYDPLTR